MATSPITWRNVDSPLQDPSRGISAAANLINSGFNSFEAGLGSIEKVDRANWQQQKENNTNEFLNQIYAANGPEGFKALQDSGQLQQMLAGYGAQVDQAKSREVMDTRLSTLQQRDKQGIEYTNFMADERQRPITQQILSEAALGNKDKALALMAANPDLRLPADLTKAIVSGERDLSRWKFEEAKQPVQLQGMGLDNAGKATSNSLNSIKLTEAQQEAKDRAETRALDHTLAVARQDYLAKDEAMGKSMGALTSELGLPTSLAGFPKFSEMTKEQRATFDAEATKRGMPVSAAYTSGDTNAASAFKKSLLGSGQFRPEILEKHADRIGSAFDSTVTGSLVGNDALAKKIDDAQKKVYYDEKDRSNWYRPGGDNARRAYLDIAKEVDGMFGADEKEDLPDVQKALHEIAVNGIKVTKNGKTERVVPSKEDVLAAVRSTREGLFFNSQRSGRIKDFLRDVAKNSGSIQMMEDGEESAVYRRDQAVKDIVYGGGTKK